MLCRYDDDMTFTPSETRAQGSKHDYAKRCDLIQHMKQAHTRWRRGTNGRQGEKGRRTLLGVA